MRPACDQATLTHINYTNNENNKEVECNQGICSAKYTEHQTLEQCKQYVTKDVNMEDRHKQTWMNIGIQFGSH